MIDGWTESEIKAIDHVLEGLGFVVTDAVYVERSKNHRVNTWVHPEGYEVQIDFSNKYPFNLRYPGQQEWDGEFSFEGIIDQLYNIRFKEKT
jgi:hypothetical protein